MAKLYEFGYKLILIPPYFRDLALSDYFIFLNLKKWLVRKILSSNDEIIHQKNAYFKNLEKSPVLEGIQKLKRPWTNRIELKEIEI